MNILIIRYKKHTGAIDGHLLIDGAYVCDTAEKASSALMAGTYPLNVVKCKQYSRKMPVLAAQHSLKCSKCKSLECVSINTTMPQRCPMIKPGNGVHNRTDASIILGTMLVHGCLTHPRQAFDDFYERIRKSIARGHELSVTIIEDYQLPAGELSNHEMGQKILDQF